MIGGEVFGNQFQRPAAGPQFFDNEIAVFIRQQSPRLVAGNYFDEDIGQSCGFPECGRFTGGGFFIPAPYRDRPFDRCGTNHPDVDHLILPGLDINLQGQLDIGNHA
jgi:hypothetical protein